MVWAETHSSDIMAKADLRKQVFGFRVVLNWTMGLVESQRVDLGRGHLWRWPSWIATWCNLGQTVGEAFLHGPWESLGGPWRTLGESSEIPGGALGSTGSVGGLPLIDLRGPRAGRDHGARWSQIEPPFFLTEPSAGTHRENKRFS